MWYKKNMTFHHMHLTNGTNSHPTQQIWHHSIVYETTRLLITISHHHHSVLQNWNTNEVWSYNMISNAIIQSHHNFTIEYNFIWSYHRIQSAYFLLDKYCQKGKLKIWKFLKVFSCQKWKRWNHHIRMFGFHIKGWVKILYFISDL